MCALIGALKETRSAANAGRPFSLEVITLHVIRTGTVRASNLGEGWIELDTKEHGAVFISRAHVVTCRILWLD